MSIGDCEECVGNVTTDLVTLEELAISNMWVRAALVTGDRAREGVTCLTGYASAIKAARQNQGRRREQSLAGSLFFTRQPAFQSEYDPERCAPRGRR